MKSWILAVPLAGLGAISCAEAAQVIGVVQEIAPDEGATYPAVRLGFTYAQGRWIPLCSGDDNASCRFDARTPARWSVRFRGRVLGDVITKDWRSTDEVFATGLLRIVNRAPSQGAASNTFAGWSDKPVHRPLVATIPALADQTPRWHEDRARADDTEAMLPLLKAHEPAIPDCSGDGSPKGKGRPLAESDLRISEAWRSASGERLLSASIKPERVAACDYTADLLADVWAYDDGHGKLQAIAALSAPEMTHALVDAGDFAGDGNEEILFWSSGYNEDGFVLLYNHLARTARISWHYQ